MFKVKVTAKWRKLRNGRYCPTLAWASIVMKAEELVWCRDALVAVHSQLPHFLVKRIPSSTVFVDCSVSIFTALHRMQTRSSDKNYSIYVCPSVKRVNCDKTKRSVQIFIPYHRSFSSDFSEGEEWLVGMTPYT